VAHAGSISAALKFFRGAPSSQERNRMAKSAKEKRGSDENLFSISGASEALGRTRRTITHALQGVKPDTIRCRVGRDVATPTPHRTGRAELPLTGSSRESFAHGGNDRRPP
jgi:hypothetical protein